MRRLLADLIRTEVKDPRIPMMTSVTDVEVSGDLSQAVVFVSVMGTEEEQKACISALAGAAGFLRREIGRKMRIRVTPELKFRLDTSITQGIRMSNLIDQAMGRSVGVAHEQDEDENESEDDNTDLTAE